MYERCDAAGDLRSDDGETKEYVEDVKSNVLTVGDLKKLLCSGMLSDDTLIALMSDDETMCNYAYHVVELVRLWDGRTMLVLFNDKVGRVHCDAVASSAEIF